MNKKMRYTGVAIAAIGGLAGWFLTNNLLIGIAVACILAVPVFMSVYVPYAQDNPKKYWFKRKLYGWGWTPVTWQGWAVTLAYLALVAAFALTLDAGSSPREIVFTFGIPVILLTLVFTRVAYKTGEKPRWQWGDAKKEE